MDRPGIAAAVKPFIIWTLQRTGGTNFTQRLVELSGLAATQHEPFNLGRAFGHLTQHWMDTQDRPALDAAVADILRKGEVIKHCVEAVPWDVTESLAHAAVSANYNHLVLYRRNAADRLLSLHFAQQTGVWGPDMKAVKAVAGARETDTGAMADIVTAQALGAALPIDELVAHERNCRQRLQDLGQRLQRLGATPLPIAYEDIYRAADPLGPVRVLAPVLKALGLLNDDARIAAWVRELVGTGDQGTRDQYRHFPGSDELQGRLQSLPDFDPAGNPAPVTWRTLAPGHPWIMRFFIDVLPAAVRAGEPFEVGGVLVLSSEAPDRLGLQFARSDGTMIDLHWGQPSQRMATEHPTGKNAAAARWSGVASFTEQDRSIFVQLLGQDGAGLNVGEILCDWPENSDRVTVEPEDRLIFDIGANDGADTRYYLSKGFRVIAVEAIPELAEDLRRQLAPQITAGRLVVVWNAVTATAEGDTELVINEERTEWSSAHQESKSRSGIHRTVSVPTTTLANLIAAYGAPYYVKVDIEGGELDAVRSLIGLPTDRLPPYFSFETNQQVFEVLQALWDLGYRDYQLVRQGAPHLPPPPGPRPAGGPRQASQRHAPGAGPGHCDRHREPDDGGGVSRRHHGDRERGARA